MNQICRSSDSLATIFLTLFPITLFNCIARMSEKYAFKDWVAPVEAVDRDVIIAKKTKLQPCKSNDPNKRHGSTEGYHFTSGYIICWIGILIYYGSLGISKSPKNFGLICHMEYMHIGYRML